ncbi:tetratricopeptide repeat protein, partial [Arcobacter sp. LA11]|uniref:tetratricopeptide repeat protein n=1 Tax=Arcobacter sp. LA11 TaxID=1898176 RepID=UPI001160CACD
KQENIKVIKTNYNIETCKKETYTQKDLKEYQNLIESGEIQGYNCLGIYYIKTTKDYEKAEEYFKKGIKAGSVESYYQLGSLYSTFMEKDSKYIIREYEKAASKGHTLAMHNLAVQYYNQAKFDEAIKWYRKSADSGDNYSLEGLGHTYRMKGDLEKARETYLKLAVERKDPQGYKNLGIFYSQKNRYKDLKKSKNYFLKCIEYGDNDCYTALAAAIYEKEKDYTNAIIWYKKGFKVGTKSSINRLGFLYTDILKDYEKAIYWLKKGYEELDYLDAAFLLAYLYEENLKDYQKAVYWYKIGHNKGDHSSTQNLGYLYEKHLKDYKNAEIWYRKSLKTKNYKKAERGLRRLKKLGVLSE